MTTATITKPKSKKGKPKRMASPKPTSKPEVTNRGSNAPCENCSVKSARKTTTRKKKKPMYKIGCWRGIFKGTLDF